MGRLGHVLIGGVVQRLQNFNGHRSLIGHCPSLVCGGKAERVLPHLVLLGRVGEGAVLPNGYLAPLGRLHQGEGQLAVLRVLRCEVPGELQILIGLQRDVLRHGGLILFAPDGDGHHSRLLHPVAINGQISELRLLPAGRCGVEGHGIQLPRGENVPGTNHPAAQLHRAQAPLRDPSHTDAGEVIRSAGLKFSRLETINHPGIHLRVGRQSLGQSRAHHARNQRQRQEPPAPAAQGKGTISHGKYLL